MAARWRRLYFFFDGYARIHVREHSVMQDNGWVLLMQNLEAPRLEVDLHRRATDPEQRRADQDAAEPRRGKQVAQVAAEGRDAGRAHVPLTCRIAQSSSCAPISGPST